MPGLDHAFIVSLFQDDGMLAFTLLEPHLERELRGATAEVVSEELTQTVPTEYRADSVIVHRDSGGRATLAIVVEVQRQIDEDKQWSWPVYLAATRARYRCPTVLLVVAPGKKVAAWARTPIELDPLGSKLHPIVLSYAEIPEVLDADLAQRSPQLAVLSAIAHRDPLLVQLALAALGELSHARRRLYSDAILRAMLPRGRAAKGNKMNRYMYKSYLLRAIEAQGMRTNLTAVARAKLGKLTENEALAIETIRKEEEVVALTEALVRARSLKQARILLDALVKRRRRQIARLKAQPPLEDQLAKWKADPLMAAIML